MIKLVITADDFTGALDTAVQFSRNSTGTAVMFYNDLDFSGISGEVRVVVIDTESRHVSPAEAARRVREAVYKAKASGVTHFYKKTDSVLRGNVGSELLAIMEAAGSNDLMFVPAYPDMRRTTREGCQYLNGIPLNETVFARDPIDPVNGCDIANIIKMQADVEVIVVRRNEKPDLTNGYGSDRSTDTGDKAGRIYVFDAENNIDLKNIAGLLKSEGKLELTAGCAGFAGMLPEALGLCGYRGIATTGNPAGKMLTVCGSINEISLRQVRFAEKNGFCRITPEPGQLLTPGYFDSEAGNDFIQRTARLINDGKDVIISAAASQADRECFGRFARENKIDEKEIPFSIPHSIAVLVRKIADIANPGILTVVGGDTAAAIAYSMGFGSVVPRYDIETGVVLSEAFGYGDGIILITKSGGFGNEDVLVKVRECMKNG